MKSTTRLSILLAPFLAACIGLPASAQNSAESKPHRIEQLKLALTKSDHAVDTLESIKGDSAGQHTQEVEAAKKSRNALQRMINELEGRDPNAGLAKVGERDARVAKTAATTDVYSAMKQARQDLEDSYGILKKDPGVNNPQHKNAIKFLDEAHKPLVTEIEAYERAHPGAQPAAAAPGASATPSATPAMAPATPGSSASPDARVPELLDAISHLDHSIDYVTAQPASDSLRSQTLASLVKSRDTIRQLADQLSNKDLAKDVQSDHARDASSHLSKTPDYYQSLISVQQYLHNDSLVLVRQPDDANHLHQAAVQAMAESNKLVQQQIDAYHKAHPGK